MTWEPIHKAHAIEMARVMVRFSSPVSEKLLAKSMQTTGADLLDNGFDEKVSAGQRFQKVIVDGKEAQLEDVHGDYGWVFRRTVGQTVQEEAGFRGLTFGYLTRQYPGWSEYLGRYKQVFEVAIDSVLETVEIQEITLEYWDRFLFVGKKNEAAPMELLSGVGLAVSKQVIDENSLWHSHTGWIELTEGMEVLVNRNIAAVDSEHEGGDCRAVTVHTLVRMMDASSIEGAQQVFDALDVLHGKSKLTFGEVLIQDYQNRIGLSLGETCD